MKIAIPARGEEDAPIMDPRFGRCDFFVVVDEETGARSIVRNAQNRQALQGAGIQAAQTVAGTGAKVVLTGHCGPKAFRILAAEGIAVHLVEGESLDEALEAYRRGETTASDGADVEGHWA